MNEQNFAKMKTFSKDEFHLCKAVQGHPDFSFFYNGFLDLRVGRESIESLLIELSSGHMRELGFQVSHAYPPTLEPEMKLYWHLCKIYGDDAHQEFNVLEDRLEGFQRDVRRLII